jgi:hypothetical protein
MDETTLEMKQGRQELVAVIGGELISREIFSVLKKEGVNLR